MPAKDTVNLTDPYIKKSLAPKDKEYSVREKGGFGVRILPSGRKTFFFMYSVDGHRKFLNLGEYPATTLKQAREDYEQARQQVKALKAGKPEGVDPVEERKNKSNEREEHRKAPTVKILVEDYIERHAKRFKRSWEKDEQILNRDVIPLWGKRKAAEIAKKDVVRILHGVVDRGAPAMANNCFQIIRKMFNWAVENDILTDTPCKGVKLPSPKVSRERTLAEAEIKTMWDTLDNCAMSEEIRRALKLILVTAQRPGEVIGMRSSEVDGNWWTIPAERAKNGKTHRVFLTKTALDLIGPLKVLDEETGEEKPKGYVFRTPVKKKEQAMAPQALIVAVARGLAFPVADDIGNPVLDKDGNQVTENRVGIAHFTPHDLRRTAATFMAEMGTIDEVIDAILNHAKTGVIKVYNQYRYDKEKQVALESWERKLTSITTGKATANIISLAEARGKISVA